ncbi:tyrosine-type recombinase/integrase [Dethiosulfovibrio faecalis]|uniref:tyrosine-type recombinase/integrase n=1 Tax=Dethiosulfovibrio faecalis TaxID=2720018 RepID=UPI0021076D98|nr:tyrosine-type recombinase/integrase [Dethiosulfovibrio faecalis]
MLLPYRKSSKAVGKEQAYRILNSTARTVRIKNTIGTHILRKTFAYHAYKSGHNLSMIQNLLNHSAPSVTLRYIGITKEEMDNIFLTLNL